MNTDDERPLRMMIVYAGQEGGFHLALVPAALSLEQVEAAFRESESMPRRCTSWAGGAVIALNNLLIRGTNARRIMSMQNITNTANTKTTEKFDQRSRALKKGS